MNSSTDRVPSDSPAIQQGKSCKCGGEVSQEYRDVKSGYWRGSCKKCKQRYWIVPKR